LGVVDASRIKFKVTTHFGLSYSKLLLTSCARWRRYIVSFIPLQF